MKGIANIPIIIALALIIGIIPLAINQVQKNQNLQNRAATICDCQSEDQNYCSGEWFTLKCNTEVKCPGKKDCKNPSPSNKQVPCTELYAAQATHCSTKNSPSSNDKVPCSEITNAISLYCKNTKPSPFLTVAPLPTEIPQKTCTRCSYYYENQRASWQANDCNLNPAAGVTVTRTFDPSCTPSPTTRRNNCQRCSTVNNKEYVWWEPEAGKTCNINPSGTVTIYRAPKDDCRATTTSPAPTKAPLGTPVPTITSCVNGQTKCIGRMVFKCNGKDWAYSQVCPSMCVEGKCISTPPPAF